MHLRRMVIGLALVGFSSSLAANDGLSAAQASLTEGDYLGAYQQFLPHAEAEDGLAQFSIGLMLENQWIQSESVGGENACTWFKRAAQQGIPMAQQFLGDCYAEGIYLDEDPEEAVRWYLKAAESGIHSGSCRAGKLYLEGRAHGLTEEQALDLCRASAARGGVAAAISLGRWYLKGQYVNQDLNQAKHYLLSVASRSPEAAYLLGLTHQELKGTDDDLLQARYWLETAASQGYKPAYLPTAKLYYQDQSSAESEAKAYLWLKATITLVEDTELRTQAESLLASLLERIPESWPEQLQPTLQSHLDLVTE